MTLKTPIFLENNTTTQNADELRLERQGLLIGRAGILGLLDYRVTQRGAGANMSVDVAAGGAHVLGTENSLQGGYHVYNDATVNVVVPAADITNPRKDLVIVNVRDSFYSGANNDAQLQYVTGTPAASPAEPDLVALGYKNYFVLAMVDVPASDTSITDSQITDRRTRASAVGGTIICTSTTRPASPWAGMRIYETDTKREYVSDATNWLLQGPDLPHTTVVAVSGGAGSTSSTSNVDLPTALSISNFVKHRSDTKLIVEVYGRARIDDASGLVTVAVDVAGTDHDVANCWTPATDNVETIAGAKEITGLAAGTITTIKGQWRVGAGTVVAQMVSVWTLKVTESF